jgi:hypothetical protein
MPVFGQPSNDECVNATVITSIPFTDIVDATTATSNPADPSLGCNWDGARTDGNTVWYVWTPTDNVHVQISTFGSDYDTVLGVYTGDCENLVEVACLDVGLADAGMFEAEADVTYFIKVGEFLDGSGGGNLTFRVGELETEIIESVADGLSDPINTLATSAAASAALTSKSSIVKEMPMFMREEKVKMKSMRNMGVTMDGLMGETGEMEEIPAKLLQLFEGAENDDNDNLVGYLLYPPDTDGDVGPNHYVQMTNLVTTIFDKSGNVVLGPVPNNIFWTGLGGPCEFTNIGDPIVLYDEETERWLISQFNDPAGLCIACSETSDPTGKYYQHEFDFTSIGFPDYPKYGFATDAIGVMVNLYAPFQGAALGAIDKSEAFSSGPTSMVLYRLGTSEWGFVVGDNDGPVYRNMPPTFATNNGFSGTRIDFWEIQPDFATPTNSTISEVAKIPVSPFDTYLCGAYRGRCIDQPEGAPRLEAITDRLMHRLQLRNFGKEKRAVVTHTVDADGTGKAGKRWYEFRNHRDRGWTLFKENTFSPDGDHRWMGSIAMNAKGKTCLGYSISSTTTYPSIGITGRRGLSGYMSVPELIIHDGNEDQHVQLGTSARWGDYSAMAVDPVDDTFWYTQEYTKPNTRLGELAGWATKIAQISLKEDDNDLSRDVLVAEAEIVPDSYALLQNHPNPFNPETEIRFQLPEAVHVTVKIFNNLGQEIRLLTDKHYEVGHHSVNWDSKDSKGNAVSSGIYLYELKAGTFSQVMKMNLVK